MAQEVAFRPETLAAVDAVSRGSATARARTGAGDIRHKGPRDLVTGTDVAVEDEIRAALGGGLDIPVVGEERGGAVDAVGVVHWLVDPICGTRNYAFGLPLYCVNVALVENGRITAAVVGDPEAGRIWVAELDGGAWSRTSTGWEGIRVRAHSAVVAIEDSHTDPDAARRDRAAGAVAAAIRANRWDVRAIGSSLGLAYVAAGHLAAYALFAASALHCGAGSLLAAEAGGVVSDLDGRPWTLGSDSVVVSATPALHDQVLAICAPEPAREP